MAYLDLIKIKRYTRAFQGPNSAHQIPGLQDDEAEALADAERVRTLLYQTREEAEGLPMDDMKISVMEIDPAV